MSDSGAFGGDYGGDLGQTPNGAPGGGQFPGETIEAYFDRLRKLGLFGEDINNQPEVPKPPGLNQPPVPAPPGFTSWQDQRGKTSGTGPGSTSGIGAGGQSGIPYLDIPQEPSKSGGGGRVSAGFSGGGAQEPHNVLSTILGSSVQKSQPQVRGMVPEEYSPKSVFNPGMLSKLLTYIEPAYKNQEGRGAWSQPRWRWLGFPLPSHRTGK